MLVIKGKLPKSLNSSSLFSSNINGIWVVKTALYINNVEQDLETLTENKQIMWDSDRETQTMAALDVLRVCDLYIGDYRLMIDISRNTLGVDFLIGMGSPVDESGPLDRDIPRDPPPNFEYKLPAKRKMRKGKETYISRFEVQDGDINLTIQHGNYFKEIAGKTSRVHVDEY